MRFMMLMIPKGYESAPAGTMPDPEQLASMMRYNRELNEAGILLALDCLHPPATGVRVSFVGKRPAVVEGPFPEAKEGLGGYWMIQVKSREEAVEWAKRCPAGDGNLIEVREVFDLSEFSPEVQKVAHALKQAR